MHLRITCTFTDLGLGHVLEESEDKDGSLLTDVTGASERDIHTGTRLFESKVVRASATSAADAGLRQPTVLCQ